MLNREKVELMTELAFYEQNEGKDDFKINEYYRKDYAGYHAFCSVLWVTVGYVVVIGLAAMACLDFLLEYLTKSMMIKMGLVVIAVYLLVVVLYMLAANRLFDQKHRKARKRMRVFNHNLIKLLKMYDKERQ